MRIIPAAVQTALELLMPGKGVRNVTLLHFSGLGFRWTSHNKDHTWEGDTYQAYTTTQNLIMVRDISDNIQGEIPAATIILHNLGLNSNDKARFWSDTLRGEAVSMTIIHPDGINGTGNEIRPTWTDVVDSDLIGPNGVILRLGALAAGKVRIPTITTRGYGCQHLYGPDAVSQGVASKCTYRGSLKTCSRIYDGPNGCKDHYPDITYTDPQTGVAATVEQTKPFGGELTALPDIVRVA